MKVKLNENLSTKKTLTVLSLLSVLTAVACVALSDVLVPVLIALLAALFCFDSGAKKIYAYSSAAIALAISIIGQLFVGQFLVLWGVQSIVLAWIIYVYCSKGKNKMECVLICTIVYSLFIVLSFAIFAMTQCQEVSVDAVFEYYSTVIEQLRAVFVDNMYAVFSQVYASGELTVTAEMLSQVYDAVISCTVSYIIISAFVCVGIASKLFTAIAKRYTADKDYVLKWRFSTPSMYAYFYITLVIASVLAASGSGIFAVSVSNLYNIFMVVYAYIGFNFALGFLEKRRKKALALIILLAVTVLFFNFALEILAMIGAFGTIKQNKEITA